jgi:hypothetical protein
MDKILTGLAVVALAGSSLGANASIIECNMESISNPNYEICANLDVDNSRLSFDITSTGADPEYGVSGLGLTDFDNTSAFLSGTAINYGLSSNLDSHSSGSFSHGSLNNTVSGDVNNLNLTLDITNTGLMNSIIAGTTGVDYAFGLANLSNSNSTETLLGEAFYAPSTSVPEPSTLGLFSLGLLGAGFVGSRRNKKTFESS